MNKYFSLKKRWKEVVDAGTGTEAKFFRQRELFDQQYGTKASTKPQVLLDSGNSATGDIEPESLTDDASRRKRQPRRKERVKRKSTEMI